MYIIYEHTLGILQVGFLNPNELSLSRGIFIQDINKKYLQNKNLFFINTGNNNSSTWKYANIYPDFRYIIHNKYLKNTLFYIFKLFFLKMKLFQILKSGWKKYKKIKKHSWFYVIQKIIFISLIIISVCYFIAGGLYLPKKELTLKNSLQNPINPENITLFKNIFKETKIAKEISDKKYSYIEKEIPNLRGISSFQVLALTSQQSRQNENMENPPEYSGIIAVPFKTIIKINKTNSMIISKAFLKCAQPGTEEFYLFKISENDELILFKKDELENEVNYPHFFIFKDDQKNQQCDFLFPFLKKERST